MILHFTFGGLYMFRFIIGITAFILSFVGYGISLRKKEVPRDFIPIIIFRAMITARTFSAAGNKWFHPRLDFQWEWIPASAALAGAAFYLTAFYFHR